MPYYNIGEKVKVYIYSKHKENGRLMTKEVEGKIVNRYQHYRKQDKKGVYTYYDVEQTARGRRVYSKIGTIHKHIPEFNITPMKPYTSATRSAKAEIKLKNRINRSYTNINHNSLPARLTRSLVTSGHTRNSGRSVSPFSSTRSNRSKRSARSTRSANKK